MISDDDSNTDPAPLFKLFWENSSLNTSRARVLRERIATDAGYPYQPYRPSFSDGVQQLPKSTSALEDIWSNRKSQRSFSSEPLTVAHLSNLLRPFAADKNNQHALSSGGAKYPMMIFTALLNVTGLENQLPQLAWYHPEHHGLVPLHYPLPDWTNLATILGVDWPNPPALCVFLIARSEPLLTKYSERGGRFMLLEAGAHMLALEMEVSAANMSGAPIGSFFDREILKLLRLDDHNHQAVLCYACGFTENSNT